jgi:GTP-binding protein Era
MGKSSLVNALLQEELCIATHRPQTTRHAILAVLNSPHPSQCQLCFLDTPGIIDKPAYKLQEGMMEAVQGAFHDADVLLVVTDVFSTPIPSDVLFQRVVQLSQSNQKKVIIAINKVDLLSKVGPKNQRDMENHIQDGMGNGNTQGIMEKPSTMQDIILHWRRLVPDAIAIIPLCASKGGKDIGVEALRTLLLGGSDVTQAFEKLGGPFPGMFLPHVSMIQEEDAQSIIPISPPLYSLDTLTDRNSRYVWSSHG